ncbi:hypothetical protein PTKIN_Ptkin17bG0082500 [Pterospermum kingtungense]
MSDSDQTDTPGAPSPNDSSSDMVDQDDQLSESKEVDDSPAAPPPSSNSTNSNSPPPDDSSNDLSPSDADPPQTSASPPPSPPVKTPPPPPKSPPPPSQQSSTPSSSVSPPTPPNNSNNNNQQSPTPPKSPSQDSSQPSPTPPSSSSSSPSSSSSFSPPSSSTSTSSPSQSSSGSSPSPPSPSSQTSQSPPSANSTPTPTPVLSPPAVNASTASSPGLSPKTQAPSPPSPPISTSNSTATSSNSSGGSNNNKQNNSSNTHIPTYEVVICVTLVGIFIVVFLVLFLFQKRMKKRQPSPNSYANNLPPPANFSVTSDAFMGHSPQNNATHNYNSQYQGQQQSNMVNSLGSQRGQNHHVPDSGIIPVSKISFAYEELMEMTKGFTRQNVIGEGGFGCVYKGWMADGRAVAVKQLKAGSGQGEREFRAEVEIISRVHHRHLVSLVGYCIAENQRLLIYEFVSNGTLERRLHGKDQPELEWAKRVKIAVGAAKGLAYLHEDCHPKIIHRDIKSANILLDEDFEAKVADFGLARLNDTSQSHVSTRVMGTFGYLAPEYASSGKLTDRSDVYSFGVVLLELITGRKPVDPTRPLGDESLVEWARPLLIQALETGNFGELIDPRLQKRYVESQMFRMIEAAAACVRHSAAKRPRMTLLVRALDFDGESDLTNGVKFGQSTAYDSSQYSEEITRFRMMGFGSDNSSGSEMYSGEDNSRELPNSWKSRYSSGDFTSGGSESQAFNKPPSGQNSGASGNNGGGRFR